MKDKRLVVVGILLLLVGWGLWCSVFLPRGLSPNIEGRELSVAIRLAQGDVLFRDSTASSASLVYFWESLVVRVYPDLGFLGMRILWAIAMFFCSLLTIKLMLRHFTPLVSIAAGTAGLLFVDALTSFKVPRYNTLPALPLLLAVWLWLISCSQKGNRQLLLAAAAGGAAFMATTCRITLVVLVLIPVLTIVYDRLSGVNTRGLGRASAVFLAAYMVGAAIFFLSIELAGLTGDFWSGLSIIEDNAGHGLDRMAHRIISSVSFIMLSALALALVVILLQKSYSATAARRHASLLANLGQEVMRRVLPILCVLLMPVVVFRLWDFTPTLRDPASTLLPFVLISAFLGSFLIYRKSLRHPIPIILVSVLLLGLLVEVDYRWLGGASWVERLPARLLNEPAWRKIAWIVFVVATGVVLTDLILHMAKSRWRTSDGKAHERGRLGVLAIFICIATIIGTNELPPRPVWLSSWLVISLAVGLSCVWLARRFGHVPKLWMIRSGARVGALILLAFLCFGIWRNFYPFLDRPIWELTATPETGRLRGIFTTPERAHFIDSVVDAVNRNSEAGDRILVFYNLPWVYYLTDRLPSTRTTWLMTDIVESSLQYNLEDMTQRGREPCLVVMNYPWPDPRPKDTPILEFVEERYEVVEIVSREAGEPGHVSIMLPKAASQMDKNPVSPSILACTIRQGGTRTPWKEK